MKLFKQRKAWCALGEARLFGDLTVLLNVVGAADYDEDNVSFVKTFCNVSEKSVSHLAIQSSIQALGIRPKAFNEINKVRKQLAQLLNEAESVRDKLSTVSFKMDPPSQEQLRKLRSE